jgi:hypothetical protein
MKSREETSTKNGRSEVTNRHDGLGLGLERIKSLSFDSAARRRRCAWRGGEATVACVVEGERLRRHARLQLSEVKAWRRDAWRRWRGCSGGARARGVEMGWRCERVRHGTAERRRGRWRRGERQRGRRLGFGGGSERIEREDQKTRSECTVKRGGRSAFNAMTGRAGRLTGRGGAAFG